jgi:hypothetical protein
MDSKFIPAFASNKLQPIITEIARWITTNYKITAWLIDPEHAILEFDEAR